jgi:hypothetical protein
MAKWKLSSKAIKEQIAKAKERTSAQDAVEPRATKAYYDQGSYRIVVELSNGSDFRFSPSSVQELIAAAPDELAQVEISPSGRTLRWKKLDADLSLPGLMMGVFGTKLWMAHLGRMGGQATSEAKAAAARLNGMRGGRPEKGIDVDSKRKTVAVGKAVATSRAKRTSPVRRVKGVAAASLGQSHKKATTVHAHKRPKSARTAYKITVKKK